MPKVLLTETFSMELGAQDPWPQLIKMYQPHEVEQILLPDNSNCLAVQAYLKMCNLEFQVEPRRNAEYMSPSGRVPFIQCGAFVVSDFNGIVNFINSKGTSLSDELEATDKADMRAYISLVNDVLVNAEQYICWCEPNTLNNITKPRYGSVYPWPLNHILNWQKQSQVIKKLKVLGWYNKTLPEVLDEVKNCCDALSERLESKTYFFGERPTELDALVYGHVKALTVTEFLPSVECISNTIKQPNELDALVFGHMFTILTTSLPNNLLANIINNYPTLVTFCKRIETSIFYSQAIDDIVHFETESWRRELSSTTF